MNKIAFFSFYIIFMTQVQAGGGAPAAVVQVSPAEEIEIAPFVWVVGTVISRFDSNISAEVKGNLIQVLDVGEFVKQGEVIAKIANTPYQLALDEIQAEIKPIETMGAFYQRESERLAKLALHNNAAKSQLDETEANRDESVAKIRVTRAKLAMAHDNLDKTIIRAPFTGIVSTRLKADGEWVEAGDPVVRLINTKSLEIQAYIPQNAVDFVKPETTLVIKTDQYQGTGQVRIVVPVGDERSRLYEIRVRFEQDLPVGTGVKVAVPVQLARRVIAVPRDALVIRQTGIVIYKVHEQNFEIVPVKTGISNTSHIEVLGNVQAQDSIIIRGNERLRPGQAVQIIDGNKP